VEFVSNSCAKKGLLLSNTLAAGCKTPRPRSVKTSYKIRRPSVATSAAQLLAELRTSTLGRERTFVSASAWQEFRHSQTPCRWASRSTAVPHLERSVRVEEGRVQQAV